MELIDYVRIARRRWALILIVVIACVGGAGIATKLATPKYEASAELIVNGSSSVSAGDEIATRELAEERATAFAQIIGTVPAVRAALKQADETSGPFNKTGYPSVSASASGTSPFISIRVTDVDPHRAQAVANAYITVLPAVLKQLEQGTPAAPEELSVLSAANYPASPSSPRPKRNLLIGFALGLVLGGGVALVRESLDRRLKDSQDVEDATGLPVLAVVPFEMPGEPIPAESHPMSVRAEAYRKVRTNLMFVRDEGPPRSIVITSSTSNEGKTSLACNLAIAYAKAGQRVALLDADLRRPMVHIYFGIPSQAGLVDVLAGTKTLEEVTQFVHHGQIAVIACGPVPANPSELMGSAKMLETIRTLEFQYDMVILDTPPVLPVADALVVGVNADGVAVVTRLGETTKDKLRRTQVNLAKVRANVVGVVPNGAIQREDSAYAYAYRYRSRKKAASIPYAPRDPQVEPQPADLRPATRRPLPEREPTSGATAVQVETLPPRSSGRHFARFRQDRPAGPTTNGGNGHNEHREPPNIGPVEGWGDPPPPQ